MPPLTFLHGSETRQCTAVVDKHFEGYWALQFMQAGRLEYYVDDRMWMMEAPVFWFGFPGPHIRFHRAEGCASWHHRFISFNGPQAEEWNRAGLLFHAPLSAPTGADWPARMDSLLEAFRRPGDLWHRRAVNWLEGILIDLALAREERGTRPEWFNAAIAYLDGIPVHPDYRTLARELSMSYTTFRRLFLATAGTSPHRYLMQARLREGRRLLCETHTPIKSIAEQLGFGDVYHFSSQFRRAAGMPPAAVRRLARETAPRLREAPHSGTVTTGVR